MVFNEPVASLTVTLMKIELARFACQPAFRVPYPACPARPCPTLERQHLFSDDPSKRYPARAVEPLQLHLLDR
jgi:hypothetical protein